MNSSPRIFNPFNKFCGLFVPNWLARRGDVSHGAKLCYGRLMQFHGRGLQCNPRESVLARELGISERTCRRFLAELRSLGLIRILHRGLRRSNVYEFVEHPWMTDFRTDIPDRSERPDLSNPDRTTVSAPSVRDSVEGESKEEINPCSPLSGDRTDRKKAIPSEQLEALWSAYPNKVGKPSALRAIRAAIAQFGFEHVHERTRAYAAAAPEPRFVPAPAKFFREQRFNDDASTWKRVPSSRPTGIQVTNPAAYPGGAIKL
jgi:hypothetical protein